MCADKEEINSPPPTVTRPAAPATPFAAYLIDMALNDPRTKAMIGCGHGCDRGEVR